MILLQASIIWSSGVVSVVQSGPSWLRACANADADHSVAASRQSATRRRRMAVVEASVCCPAGEGGSWPRCCAHGNGGGSIPYSLSGQILLGGATQSFCPLRPTS